MDRGRLGFDGVEAVWIPPGVSWGKLEGGAVGGKGMASLSDNGIRLFWCFWAAVVRPSDNKGLSDSGHGDNSGFQKWDIGILEKQALHGVRMVVASSRWSMADSWIFRVLMAVESRS